MDHGYRMSQREDSCDVTQATRWIVVSFNDPESTGKGARIGWKIMHYYLDLFT